MDNFLAPWRPQLLSIFRIVSALCIMQFGVAKILKYPAVPMFANITPFSWPGGIAGLLELILGALLLVGLWSRPVAFLLAGEMALAYFIGHAGRGWHPLLNGGTLAIMFCFAFLYLAAAGPGPWSVDAARGKK